jgi:hypothetical protein
MLSWLRVPDDERKGRRLGDETKGRIADLASGWTVDSDAPPVPEPPIKRDASGPNRVPDAPRRKAKTQPPPPPGSAARKALEHKIVELREAAGEPESPRPPALPPAGRPPPPVPPESARPPSSAPGPGRKRATRKGDPLDLSTVPESDKTQENRGAVGIKHDRSASLITNTASGTIGGDTPSPIFDREAIAAGQRGAIADEPVVPGARLGSPPGDAVPRPAERGASGASKPTGAAQRSGPSPAPIAAQRSGPSPAPIAAQRSGPSPAPIAAQRSGPNAAPEGASPIGSGPAAAIRGTPRTGEPAAASGPASSRPGERLISDAGIDELVAALPAPPTPGESRLVVPVGEFDQAQTILDQDKRRIAHAQATIKRDAAGALLGLAEPAPARMPAAEVLFDEPLRARADSSFDEPTRKRDESGFDEPTRRRADGFDEATQRSDLLHDTSNAATGRLAVRDDDATTLAAPGSRATASVTLRSTAALPRRRGVVGDLRYPATVVLGLRRSRRELAQITARQATRQQSRRHHLITLGRAAVTNDGFEHKALGPAREQLAGIEDERSQHAGHVAAADAELTRVGRERDAKAKQYATDIAALDSELAGLVKKLEPLHREAAQARRRATDLHEALRRIDARIAATEASLDPAKPTKRDRAEIQAEIATLRGDRKAIQSDEPVLAGQLDALDPRIAAHEAARSEAQRKRAELETAEHDDQRRVEELLTAIGAKRKVVDRAAAAAEARRDRILFQLGERLYVDRPDDLAAELAPIDEIDLELGSGDRRIMELREILTSVHRWKLVRGVALLIVVVAALGAVTAAILYFTL